jgi:hypothetical protein
MSTHSCLIGSSSAAVTARTGNYIPLQYIDAFNMATCQRFVKVVLSNLTAWGEASRGFERSAAGGRRMDLAVTLLDSLDKSWRASLEPVLHSARRRYAMLFALTFFAYTQIERTVFVLSSRVSRARQRIYRFLTLRKRPSGIYECIIQD